MIFLPNENIRCPRAYRLNSWESTTPWTALRDTYPVLMEMISISGFFLIFGKSSLAPPNRLPLSFFWPRSLTEWPLNQVQDKHWHDTQIHGYLLFSINTFVIIFDFFFSREKSILEKMGSFEHKKKYNKKKESVPSTDYICQCFVHSMCTFGKGSGSLKITSQVNTILTSYHNATERLSRVSGLPAVFWQY